MSEKARSTDIRVILHGDGNLCIFELVARAAGARSARASGAFSNERDAGSESERRRPHAPAVSHPLQDEQQVSTATMVVTVDCVFRSGACCVAASPQTRG